MTASSTPTDATPREHLYFDCNASVGRYPFKDPRARWSTEHLLEDLQLAGISGALVYHAQALYSDPMLGNQALIAEIAAHRQTLSPAWVVLPPASGEFPQTPELVGRMQQEDVRAVRLDPHQFNVPIRERVWGELRDALVAGDVLCMISATPFRQDPDGLEALLQIFTAAKVLLVDHRWNEWRRVVDLMETFPTLHIDFSAFQANRAVEYFAGRFGAERCLFGTGLPHRAPGTARGFLDYSLLPRPQAELVAGGNLKRLLGGQGPSAPPRPGNWHDEITTAVRQGRPVPCTVLDAHCHIGHDGCSMLEGGVMAVQGDADGMIQLTRRAGIDKTAIMSWAGPLSMDTDLGNRIVEKAVKRYPEEFIGLATINPEYENEKDIERIIRRYHTELGFPGLKTFPPRQTIDYDDPLFDRWFKFADRHGLYLVYDPRGGDEGALRCAPILAERYPNMGIHLDHCGTSWKRARTAVELMGAHPSIWAQLTYTDATNGVIEYLVESVGSHRVLFGTDSPMRDPRPQVTWVVFTRLPVEKKREILGQNFAGVLDRAHPRT